MAKSGVKFKRQEASDAEVLYTIIQDALDGEIAIKAKGATYLPIPSDCKTMSVTDPRYVAYQTRAVYYNVTQPTRDALVGQLFLRPPQVKVPTELEPMLEDMNGEGLTIEQLTRKAANHILPFGRGGFLTDFPATDGEVTRGDLKEGKIRPLIRFIEPWAIRNWRYEKIGTVQKLTLLVIDETYEATSKEDEFNTEIKLRHRVYKLKGGACQVEVWHDDEEQPERYTIKGSTGEPLDSIPFDFLGSENNDADVDEPPFYNLANLNISHFRNSADYEESVFLVGQPTPVYAGLTEDWVENYFPKGIPFGARASVPLPEKATAQLLQALPNTLAFEAMKHKEAQMIAIGAKILQPKSAVERKEKEIEIEAASQKSILTTTKDNLQLGLIAAMKRAAAFVGANADEIEVSLNDNFDLTSMSSEEIRWLLELYNSPAGITFSEFRENLRRSGIAKLTDEEAISEFSKDRKMKDDLVPALEKEAAETAKIAAANPAVGKAPGGAAPKKKAAKKTPAPQGK